MPAMIFAASDVSFLSHSLHRWEWAEYISEGFVILACAGELVVDFGENWLGERRKKHLQRRSTILLVAALSVALICLVRTNELSGNAIGSLGDKAEEADGKAKTAIADSSTAAFQAKDALNIARNADTKLRAFQDEEKQISDVVILASVSRSFSGYGGTGNPEQLHQLINQMYDNPYPSARNIARDSLHQIATQFEKEITGPNHMFYRRNSLGYMSNQPNGQATFDLLNKPDAYAMELFEAFVDLKKLTNWNVEPFDIRGAKEWCKKNDCKLNRPTR